MAGRRPREAVKAYFDPLRQAFSCVTRAGLVVSGYEPCETLHSLLLNQGEPTRLRSKIGLSLAARMLYEIVSAEGDRGPWKVRTAAYYYGLHDQEGHEILAYHWHPGAPGPQGERSPHLHLGVGSGVSPLLRKAHLPTGRVALEEILRLAIADLGVKPLRKDWRAVLARTESAFRKFRTW